MKKQLEEIIEKFNTCGGESHPTNPEIDSEIKEYIDKINLFKGVKTVASCAGHKGHPLFRFPYVGIRFKDKKLEREMRDKFKNVFAVNKGTKCTLYDTGEVEADYKFTIFKCRCHPEDLAEARKVLFEAIISFLDRK